MTANPDFKQLAQVRFSRFAEHYVHSPELASQDDLARLLAIAQPQSHWHVLDVATGGGHTAAAFAPYVTHVWATDLVPAMLQAAQAHFERLGLTNVSFLVADAEALPFPDASFDLVTCRIAPHHFPNVSCFLQEAARVLRPGGLLLLQDHLLPENEAWGEAIDAFERLRDPSHHRAYSATQWQALVEAAGLWVEHLETLTKVHPFEAWADRQGCSAELKAKLIAWMKTAPPGVQDWMQPKAWGTPEATFLGHYVILSARKPGSA
ncbi:class I SAM-dependent methyltransferase [Rhodothermus bifroesti]|jgi:ubiquinone/menaquinone biosynthesis C-methylase UbiE|uniref:Class I SAM-dependent methyltransferase n=1 Tax=Rhodothermus marinus TaxID=29549 RepID=A0A7V2B054_RHOMR|nr:class I SAM-dependent methyltransferase [Rhodothermus bifroesti]